MNVRLSLLLLLVTSAQAGIVDDVRLTIAQGNLSAAVSQLETYRAQHGSDAEYLEGLSWIGRGYLSTQQLDQAESYAKQTESGSRELLKHRTLDADKHLPIALGAAFEVEAQVLVLRHQNAQAAALLRRAMGSYGTTSIKARLQKNLNMLGLTGQTAPPLNVSEYLGVRPTPIAQEKGSPVLLFFWAHWCKDCKQEGPIISQLASDFAAQGLRVEAPTQLYGYAAQGQDASPKDELAYIGQVWQHYYPALQDVPVPVSKANFDRYGASTTPTLVLVDKKGRVALYHPGVMSYDDLRAVIQNAL
jgi:thiol-disulfide isomerase/thioredoxin